MNELLPDELATKAAYDTSASAWVSNHDEADFWKDEMARFHGLLPSGSILEIGSGGARDAKRLVELGYGYVGTDVSQGLLEIARANLPDYEFVEQSVYDLDLPQAPFDGFWASAVLLHIPRNRIDEALGSIRHVMRARAVGFISIKDGASEGMETDVVSGAEIQRFFCRWSKERFGEVLARNGFSIVDYIYRPMSERTKWHCFFVSLD